MGRYMYAFLLRPDRPAMGWRALCFVPLLFTSAVPPLPPLNVDPAGISVSGISSGADFAVQLQVAYSSLFVGAGVFAGQAYHCAVHRFPGEELQDLDPSVPYCDNCP